MRRYLIAALALTVISISPIGPAAGQSFKAGAGWGGGVLVNTGMNDGASGTDLVEMKPDPTWLISVHYDQWFGAGNIGVRARGGFSKPVLPWVQGDREIRVYMADLGILLRPIAPAEGNSVLPFLGAGVGFMNWGFGDGAPTTFDPAGATYPGEESYEFVATAGLGVDVITPWSWGEGPLVVRLEARDHLQFTSPFEPANPDDGDFGLIHNGALVLGFYTGIGVLGG